MLVLLGLATFLSMGFTFANCAAETGGGNGPVTRVSPTWTSVEDSIPGIVVFVGIVLAVVLRERGAGFIALALGGPLFTAGVCFVALVFSRGPFLFDSMRYVETVEGGPNGEAAHLHSNGGGCFEVYVSERGSFVMHRRGRFHANRDNARIAWVGGKITHDAVPLENGSAFCKDWL